MGRMEFFAAALAAASLAEAADNLPPARVPPGGLPVAQVPQFVCITSDDNYYPSGFKFFLDAMAGKKSPSQTVAQAGTFDGAPATMSFYVNTNNGGGNAIGGELAGYFKQAVAGGFEIGDHTRTHATSSTTSLATWTSEIENVISDLASLGLSRSVVTGFRTPYLAYNDNTFKALDADKQFRYDCSIMSGHDAATDGTNFVWPYTLDGGPYSADLATVPAGVQVAHHPGLWEVPVYCIIVPPALRHDVWVNRVQKVNGTTYTAVFDTANGKVTGMDYNILSGPSNYGGLGLDSAQYASSLKHSLDLRLQGNRAPFCFTTHSNIFYDNTGWADEGNSSYNGPGAKTPKATVNQARGAIADFLAYALTKPEVRVVTQQKLVDWCAHPVAFTSAVGTGTLRETPRGLAFRALGGKLSVSGLPIGERISLSLYSLTGSLRATSSGEGPAFTWSPGKLRSGLYLVQVRGDGWVTSKRLRLP